MTTESSILYAEKNMFGNLLDERLLHYRRTDTGERIPATLPELFVAMAQDHVLDFPALRPHQRHPWHAFLVQLAAIALHHAERTEPFATATEWRAALLALTPDDSDGAAWCLVSPIDRPAFLQSPVLPRLELDKKGKEKFVEYDQWEKLIAVDLIDVVKASRNHDLKKQRVTRASFDDWIFALVSLQAQSSSDSGSYKQSVRVAGGYGRRASVGISTNNGCGDRWRRDLSLSLEKRAAVAHDFVLNERGVSLVWLLPWDGSEMSALSTSQLAPFFLENCRRIRFELEAGKLIARTDKTPNTRIQTSGDGKTGDIWAPIKTVQKKTSKDAKEGELQEQVFTLKDPVGFSYATAVDILFSQNGFKSSLAMRFQSGDPFEGVTVLMQSIARDADNNNMGYHERRIPISRTVVKAFLEQSTDDLAKRATDRTAEIAMVKDFLEHGVLVLFNKALQFTKTEKDFFAAMKKLPASAKRLSRTFIESFDALCDSTFFDELIEEIEASDRETVRDKWLRTLAERAELVLQSAFVAGPRSGQLRYRAQSAALGRLRSMMHGSKLPALAQALKSQKHNPSTPSAKETHEHA